MNKKYFFLITLLLLVGCSTPDNEAEDANDKDTKATSVEENGTNDTENQSDSARAESSTNDDESSTEENKDIASKNDDSDENETNDEEKVNDKENNKDNSDSSLDDKETEEENSVEDTIDSEAGSSRFIDVLSQDFINLYFSGPDTYIPSELALGMSQTEVENIYGKHETEYQLEGANLAIYGNVGILYSQSMAASELVTHIDPDENFINDVWIYINEPHSTILNTYGPPTLDYDEYELYGPGDREMIYDGTRGNGYAVYVAVQNDTAMVMHKTEERDLDSFPYTTENQ